MDPIDTTGDADGGEMQSAAAAAGDAGAVEHEIDAPSDGEVSAPFDAIPAPPPLAASPAEPVAAPGLAAKTRGAAAAFARLPWLARLALPAVFAVGLGLGQGGSLKKWFGGGDPGLSANPAQDPEKPQVAAHDEPEVRKAPEAPDPVTALEPHAPEAQPSEPEATPSASDDDAVVLPESHVAEPEKRPAPILSVPVADAENPTHVLHLGRERFEQGDLEGARRIATDFLLREDSLSRDDALMIPQAYVLLGDVMRVEFERLAAAGGAK